MRIKLTADTTLPFVRQTPRGLGVWGDCHFFINDETESCDAWVVLDDLKEEQAAHCPPRNVVLITGEPPSVKRYPTRYARQFHTVVTCHRHISHANLMHRTQGLVWLYGTSNEVPGGGADPLSYDDLRHRPAPAKPRFMSVICSDKAFTEGHRRRISLVSALKEHFGDRLDVFGRGVRGFADKQEAIDPYKYHIAIENSLEPDYWTEKLTDAYLGRSHPIYAGCANIYEYFPPGSLTAIGGLSTACAIERIETAIAEDAFGASERAVEEARSLVMDRYNLFAFVAELAHRLPGGRSVGVRLGPSSAFGSPVRPWVGAAIALTRSFCGRKRPADPAGRASGAGIK